MKYFGFWCVCLFVVVGCEVEEDQSDVEPQQLTQPFIFEMQHYFADAEYYLSFPIWFDDSLIAAHKIHSLTRRIFTSTTEMDTTNAFPKEVKHYVFRENGQLDSLKIEQYYDNQLVGSMEFTFSGVDEFGFAQVKSKVAMSSGDVEILDQYQTLVKEAYTNKFLAYTDVKNNFRYYMLDDRHWGPLSVDSILQPRPNDQIILGPPRHPEKRYQVENRVNESNVVEYTYNNPDVKTVVFDRYPFHYKRSMLYNGDGRCTGFVDSTFSSEKYLTRRESLFHFNKDLPVRLIHENNSGKSGKGYFQFETFSYSFYE